MIRTIAVERYRSLLDLKLPLGQLNLITGSNGSGKSSVYRSLRLLADVAQNQVVASLAFKGGLPSTFWAGPETNCTQRSPGNPSAAGPGKTEARQPEAGVRK
jgi:predicted ATPase